jgi:hypothetical protein
MVSVCPINCTWFISKWSVRRKHICCRVCFVLKWLEKNAMPTHTSGFETRVCDVFGIRRICIALILWIRAQGPEDLSDISDNTLWRIHNWEILKRVPSPIETSLAPRTTNVYGSVRCNYVSWNSNKAHLYCNGCVHSAQTEASGRWNYRCQVTLDEVIVAVLSWACPTVTPFVLPLRVTSPVRRLSEVNLLLEVT